MNSHGPDAAPAEAAAVDAERTASEMLVADVRSGVRPAQMVERRVLSLTGVGQLPVSWLRSAQLTRRPGLRA